MTDDEEWAAILVRTKAIREQARTLAAAGKPARFRTSGSLSYLVSPDLNYPPEADAWRVTYFQANGQPSGHFEARSRYEAFREVIASGGIAL